MSIDELKQQILMLRRQRAAVQVQIARAQVERHTIMQAMDKEIAEKTAIMLDLDVQIAEETRKYTTIQASVAQELRTPFDECDIDTQSLIRSTIAAGPDGWSPRAADYFERCVAAAQAGILIQVVRKMAPDAFLVVPKYLPRKNPIPMPEPHGACRVKM